MEIQAQELVQVQVQVQAQELVQIQKQIQSSLESIKSAKSEMVDKFCDYYSELSDGLDSTDLEVQEEQAGRGQGGLGHGHGH